MDQKPIPETVRNGLAHIIREERHCEGVRAVLQALACAEADSVTTLWVNLASDADMGRASVVNPADRANLAGAVRLDGTEGVSNAVLQALANVTGAIWHLRIDETFSHTGLRGNVWILDLTGRTDRTDWIVLPSRVLTIFLEEERQVRASAELERVALPDTVPAILLGSGRTKQGEREIAEEAFVRWAFRATHGRRIRSSERRRDGWAVSLHALHASGAFDRTRFTTLPRIRTGAYTLGGGIPTSLANDRSLLEEGGRWMSPKGWAIMRGGKTLSKGHVRVWLASGKLLLSLPGIPPFIQRAAQAMHRLLFSVVPENRRGNALLIDRGFFRGEACSDDLLAEVARCYLFGEEGDVPVFGANSLSSEEAVMVALELLVDVGLKGLLEETLLNNAAADDAIRVVHPGDVLQRLGAIVASEPDELVAVIRGQIEEPWIQNGVILSAEEARTAYRARFQREAATPVGERVALTLSDPTSRRRLIGVQEELVDWFDQWVDQHDWAFLSVLRRFSIQTSDDGELLSITLGPVPEGVSDALSAQFETELRKAEWIVDTEAGVQVPESAWIDLLQLDQLAIEHLHVADISEFDVGDAHSEALKALDFDLETVEEQIGEFQGSLQLLDGLEEYLLEMRQRLTEHLLRRESEMRRLTPLMEHLRAHVTQLEEAAEQRRQQDVQLKRELAALIAKAGGIDRVLDIAAELDDSGPEEED